MIAKGANIPMAKLEVIANPKPIYLPEMSAVYPQKPPKTQPAAARSRVAR